MLGSWICNEKNMKNSSNCLTTIMNYDRYYMMNAWRGEIIQKLFKTVQIKSLNGINLSFSHSVKRVTQLLSSEKCIFQIKYLYRYSWHSLIRGYIYF